MKEQYKVMFQPLKIGKMVVPNRFVMSPMSTSCTLDFSVVGNGIDYFEERAKGGVGMIILEGQPITSEPIDPGLVAPVAGTLVQKRQWHQLTTRIKGYSTKLCVQLMMGPGRVLNIPGVKMVSASENPLFDDTTQYTRALTVEEIQKFVKAYGAAAAMAKDVGFDAVEIHGHTGYLMDQFMTACWNHRTDQYGGSLENRMRFPVEIVQEVRKNVGPDFPILFRMSVAHKFPGGRTLEEGLESVKILDNAGVDAFDIDVGCYEAHEWIFPPIYLGDSCMVDEAAAVKGVTDKPVINAGTHTPESAADNVAKGKIDFASLGRSLIADPYFVRKIADGQEEDIRPCLRCNQYCIGQEFKGLPISCAVNMQAMAEKEYALKKAAQPKNVVVIGGGPGGMEAARVAALSGHHVKLYEKDEQLGKLVAAAAAPPFKSQLKKYREYLIRQVEKLPVEIHCGVEIGPDSLELKDADEIIVAIGASTLVPPIPGIESDKVIDVVSAHTTRHKEIGETVVVGGGGQAGCECALELAMEGKSVTVVEMLDEVATTAQMDERLALMKKLAEYSVTVMTGQKMLEIGEQGVIVENKSGDKTTLPADTVISAFGRRARSAEAEAILLAYPNAKIIGEAVSIGTVGDSVRAGFLASWTIA